ncbi:hypothetical protein DFH29DRAFT_415230 [Suillus ampliporus]|nr:hypothetical protein DFH29DRAFT_415230 [Suillus ampliporus]
MASQDPITSHSPPLPAEILSLILESQFSSPLITTEAWREIIDVLLSCSLVSKPWGEVAGEVLYRCIRLFQFESLRLLVRTVRSKNFGGHCPARALYFKPQFSLSGNHTRQLKKFSTFAAEIVACSPKLIYLRADCDTLRFTSTISLPKYPYLEKVKVSGQDLSLLAPLLHHLSNLQSFEMLRSHGDGDLLECCFMQPNFKLSALSISQTELSPGLCKWLFASSSKSIESLEVQEVGESLGHLVEVIGGSVKQLHLKNIMLEDSLKTLKTLSGFTSLRRLRISGWQFDPQPLRNLQSSLESFAISCDAIPSVLPLLQSNWQHSLQSLDVYPEAVISMAQFLDFFYKPLQEACDTRGIQVNRLE